LKFSQLAFAELLAARMGITATQVGLSTLKVEQAILGPYTVRLEIRIEGPEDRMKAVGRTSSGRILVAVFTFRGEAIRPIPGYDATIRNQNLYLKGGQYE
jgi:uncharacterized DUF497 family protein